MHVLRVLLSLAKYRVVRVDEKSGGRAAALQIATWKIMRDSVSGKRGFVPPAR